MKLKMGLFAASAIVAVSAMPATAATTVTFEGLADRVLVNNYYNGGTASNGTSGTNLGVAFANFESFAGGGNPASTIAYNSVATASSNFAAGFTTLNFLYGFFSSGTVSVFSGLNGTGTLLGTKTYSSNIASTSDVFSSGSVAFAGTAQSFILAGTTNNNALDNITFNAGAVPETATWGMMIAGFGMMGAAMRTRRRSTTITFA